MHAFLVYLTFKIKNGLRNLEEEKKIPAFCQIDESVEESKNDVPTTSIVGTQTVERKFRNSNLEKLESAKLSKGSKTLESEMKPVGIGDLADFFTLEKVSD